MINIKHKHVQYKAYICHRNIFYFKELTAWTNSEIFIFFPESPGHYKLLLQWRTPNKQRGIESYDFSILGEWPFSDGPQLLNIDNDTKILAPNRWEANMLSGHEILACRFMQDMIKPGWTIYDVGANLGVYSILASRMSGVTGNVYSIEAKPICIYFLQTNLEMNAVRNCQILPMVALDSPGNTNFTINYGNLNYGISQLSSFILLKLAMKSLFLEIIWIFFLNIILSGIPIS